MKEKDLVTVGQFSTAGEAAIYRSLLESAEIPVMTLGEIVNEIYPVGDSWAGIELKVAPEYAERARQMLAARFDPEEFRKEASVIGDPDSL
jgi:hypothetical protein